MLEHCKWSTVITISEWLPRSFGNLLFFTQACCVLLISMRSWWWPVGLSGCVITTPVTIARSTRVIILWCTCWSYLQHSHTYSNNALAQLAFHFKQCHKSKRWKQMPFVNKITCIIWQLWKDINITSVTRKTSDQRISTKGRKARGCFTHK